jgi:hypothetical protein
MKKSTVRHVLGQFLRFVLFQKEMRKNRRKQNPAMSKNAPRRTDGRTEAGHTSTVQEWPPNPVDFLDGKSERYLQKKN